ncbi:MAG: type II toxin-antitoxin system VapC family toxin [Deltaproteobacteria bacterium]|nr:type II toxin-antitoxin system VapC family toxin [Deltaproteobacteria bacterium]
MGRMSPEDLPPGHKYAIDTVTFIYFLERHSSYYQTAKRFFQRLEQGDFSAVMSSLVFAELLVPAYREKDPKRAEGLIRILTDFPNLEVVNLSPEISAEAARLRVLYQVRTPDAIHAATAIKSKAHGIITNDNDFLRLKDCLEIWLFDPDQGI